MTFDPLVVDTSNLPEPLPPPEADPTFVPLLPPPLVIAASAPTDSPAAPPPEQIVPVHYAKFDANGKYVVTGIVPSNSPTLQEADTYIGTVDPVTQYHTPAGPVDKPPQPTPEYEFNYETKTWGGDVEALRAKRNLQIEAERDLRLVDPVINYNGMLLDADAQSKQNLQDKVTATASRIAQNTPTPPEMLVWKDHTNVIHAFADLATYKAWLDGFVIALENRGMAIWGWSWQRKNDLAALTTFEQVIAFDPLLGAPTSASLY